MFRARPLLVMTTLLAAGFLAACAQDSTGPSEIEAKRVAVTPSATQPGLLKCPQRPYASAQALIGPLGGEIKIGKNKFKAPKGSLLLPTLITMELPSDTVMSVRFLPEGLTFNASARPTLTLDYKSCGVKRPPAIAYTTESLKVLQVLPSWQGDQDGDFQNDDVNSNLNHFSRYAITY